MNEKTEQQILQENEAALRRMAQIDLRPDPYLATRVLAELRERKRAPAGRQVQSWWQWLALGSSALSFVLVAVIGWHVWSRAAFEAFTDRPFVVKMEVADLESVHIAKAEIRLPDGVFFEIAEYPELKQKRNLTLAWRNEGKKEFVPIVLSANEQGRRKIEVLFYDDQGRLVGKKAIEVHLRKAAENG